MPIGRDPAPGPIAEWTLREDVLEARDRPSPEMFAGAFGLLALGFFFLLDLSFTLNQFKLTLTPDFIAFTIFYVAVDRIRGTRTKNDWLAPLLIILAIVSGIVFLAELFGASAVFRGQSRVVRMSGFGLLLALATLVVVWRLCGMIRDFALHHDRPGLARTAQNRRVIYLVYAIAVNLVLGTMLVFGLQTLLNFLLIWAIMFIAGLVVIGLLVHLALLARQATTNKEADVGLPPYPGLYENP